MSIVGYNHVAIPVAVLERAKRFYGTVLGFPEVPRPAAGVSGAWFKVGGAQLHLAVVEGAEPPKTGIPHIGLTVPADEFTAVVEAVQASEAVEVAGPRCRPAVDGSPVWSAIFRDPDGNVIEITDAVV